MSDLIKRQDAIDAVNKLDIFPPTKDAVARELMELPSAGGVVRFCDVIDDCDDCPKYGRSCDGDKR